MVVLHFSCVQLSEKLEKQVIWLGHGTSDQNFLMLRNYESQGLPEIFRIAILNQKNEHVLVDPDLQST